MMSWPDISPNQALQAVTAATEDHDGVQTVSGQLGTIAVRFRLDIAHLMIRTWPGDLTFQDGTGVILANRDGTAAYTFTAADPFLMPKPSPAELKRPGLRLVRDAAC